MKADRILGCGAAVAALIHAVIMGLALESLRLESLVYELTVQATPPAITEVARSIGSVEYHRRFPTHLQLAVLPSLSFILYWILAWRTRDPQFRLLFRGSLLIALVTTSGAIAVATAMVFPYFGRLEEYPPAERSASLFGWIVHLAFLATGLALLGALVTTTLRGLRSAAPPKKRGPPG